MYMHCLDSVSSFPRGGTVNVESELNLCKDAASAVFGLTVVLFCVPAAEVVTLA